MEPAIQPTAPAVQPNEEETTFDMDIMLATKSQNEEPDIGQYWEISNGKDSIHAKGC